MFDISQVSFIPEDTKVALIAGGTSGERPISLKSKEGAMGALTEAGYQVTWLDPAEIDDMKALMEGDFDVAFLCLHGKGGEDGAFQGFCETIGLPYTGTGIWSSATAIDKNKTKVFYEKAGIPTPEAVELARGENPNIDSIMAKLGPKIVVKAATEGSSLGVYVVEGPEAAADAIRQALEIDRSVVIERYISGIELTNVVLGEGDGSFALPTIQIVPKNESYDFESKYAPGGSDHICPAEISEESTEIVHNLAVKAHRALQCQGVSRTDFILDDNGVAWALETNTLPGMTATSLLPDAARAAGISFPDLCTYLIDQAFQKARM